MAASHGQRVFAFALALLFLLSTLSIAGFYLWDYFSEEDTTTDVSPIEDQIQNQGEEQVDNTRLQGTALAGFEPIGNDVAELKVIDLVEGDGDVVQEGARVTAHYTGAFTSDGLIFQSSKDSGQPIPFGLNEVISGWTEGVPGMKVGGTRRLIIPADMAYGPAPEGFVYDFDNPQSRPLGPLVFDIELVAVDNTAQ